METSVTKMLRKQRPAEVEYAVRLIYLSLFLGAISLFLNYDSIMYHYSLFGIIYIISAELLIIIFLAVKIAKGLNWARVLLLILTLTGVPAWLDAYEQFLSREIVFSIISIVQLVIDLAVIVLLYLKRSSEWFRKIKNSRL